MQAREDINWGSLKQDWKTCSAGVNCLDIFGVSVSQKTRSKVKCLRFMFRTRITIMYFCVQKFTSTHCGHTCHRALNYFFELFFLQSGIIVQHTSSLTLKARTGNTSLNLFWIFSIPHRAKKKLQPPPVWLNVPWQVAPWPGALAGYLTTFLGKIGRVNLHFKLVYCLPFGKAVPET